MMQRERHLEQATTELESKLQKFYDSPKGLANESEAPTPQTMASGGEEKDDKKKTEILLEKISNTVQNLMLVVKYTLRRTEEVAAIVERSALINKGAAAKKWKEKDFSKVRSGLVDNASRSRPPGEPSGPPEMNRGESSNDPDARTARSASPYTRVCGPSSSAESETNNSPSVVTAGDSLLKKKNRPRKRNGATSSNEEKEVVVNTSARPPFQQDQLVVIDGIVMERFEWLNGKAGRVINYSGDRNEFCDVVLSEDGSEIVVPYA